MFNSAETTEGLNASFSADLINVDEADRVAREFLKPLNLKSTFDILLVMRELLNNAVIHGCNRDNSKTVRFWLALDQHSLAIEVEDEGKGFDWQAVMNREPEVHWDHGRGIPIIKHYCSDIWFNEKGNRLKVKINLRD